MEFWTYYRVLHKHYRTVAIVVLIALVVGTILAWPRQAEYMASATLTTTPPDTNHFLVLVSDQVHAAPGPDTARVIQLIQSRTAAERVIQRLNLKISPWELRGRLSVTGGRDPAPLLTLSVVDPNPAEAVRLANTYAEVAVAYNQEVNRREATLAREFIEGRLQDTQTRLTQAENAVDAFKRGHGIVSMPMQVNAEVQRFLDLVNQQHSSELTIREISARIADTRQRLGQFTPTKTDKQFTENPIMQKLHGDLVNLEIQLAVARATYTEEHPTVVALKQKIQILKEAMAGEIQKVVAAEFVQVNPLYEGLVRQLIDLETQREAARAQLQALTSVIPDEQKQLPVMTDIEREYTRLSRDVQVLDTAYQSLEARLNDFRIQEEAAIDRNPVYIVDTANAAAPTSSSRTLVRILVAGMLGLVGGIGLVVFQSQIDNTLRTAKDAERLLGVPVLGSVPKHNPPFDEAYRLLKTTLGLHGTNGKTKAIMFTSPRPGSGVSTVVFHLACAIARGGKRVTVIDTDVRRPAVARLFGVVNDAGLVDVLTGAVPLQDALRAAKIENVQVLPAGANRSALVELPELFGTYAMTQLLEKIKRQAEVILIDSPPAVTFAESRALAAVVDGVVLVLAAGQAPRGVELDAKRQLERAHARVLGTVVNKVAPEDDDNYYFYEKYFNPGAGKQTAVQVKAIGIVVLLILLGAGAVVGAGVVLFKTAPAAMGTIIHGGRMVIAWLRHIIPAAGSVPGHTVPAMLRALGGIIGAAGSSIGAGAGAVIAGVERVAAAAGHIVSAALRAFSAGVWRVNAGHLAKASMAGGAALTSPGAGAHRAIWTVGRAIHTGATGVGAGAAALLSTLGCAGHIVISSVSRTAHTVFSAGTAGVQKALASFGHATTTIMMVFAGRR
ncbi:MAG TPA: polysaccharide biosynthesis tyrosine autokinase [bacterium]|nr:polysaccharide biosynthesis tyrosine autokinase [bacterium]